MKVSCPSCQTSYKIDDKRIPPGGAKLKCAKCQTTFPIRAEASAAATAVPAAVPLPGSASGAGAIPLPGSGAPDPGPSSEQSWEEESTRVVQMAVPKAAYAQGRAPEVKGEPATQVNAPGGGARVRPDMAATSPFGAAIPLPGSGAPAPAANPFGAATAPSVPLPGISRAPPAKVRGATPWEEESTRVGGGKALVEDELRSTSTDFDSFGAPAEQSGDAIPLPGQGGSADFSEAAAPASTDFADADLVDGPPPDGDSASGAVPLPGDGFESADASFDAQEPAEPPSRGRSDATDSSRVPLPGKLRSPSRPPPAREPEPEFPAEPAPGGGGELDFSDLPSPAGRSNQGGFELVDAPPPPPSRAAKAAPSSFDFNDLPAPAGDPAGADAFEADSGQLPSPAGPSPTEEGSGASFEADFGEPAGGAAEQGPAPGFGEVDLGGGPAPASGGGGDGDGLEFDPTSRPSAGGDDLEADLSAPPPSQAVPANTDGLEMLDFIDNAAAGAKAAPKSKGKRYHVRRRSGKVFGPFDEGVVVKMLEDGQLLGNEDASPDGETWSAIGTVPAFGEVIQRLVAAPSRPGTAVPGVGPSSNPDASKAMDRLKGLYEGRMAAVAVVDRSAVAAAWRKRIPYMVGAFMGVLFLVTGSVMATTRYGFFGIKAILPAKVSSGDRAYADLQRAKKALLADTFKSYQEARDAAAAALKVKEYPEVRAVWCQAIFYLQRRYAAVSPADLATANTSLDAVQMLGKKNTEVVKAFAGGALTNHDPDAAIALLEDAAARPDNQGDVELAFLRAEAYGSKGQNKLATEGLKKVLEKHKESAKAHHGLGNLYQAMKEPDLAVKSYEEALKADPNHVMSAIELAAIELLSRKNAEKGAAAVEQALSEGRRQLLGPAEQGRALALKGEALFMQFNQKDATALFEQALKLDPSSMFAKAGLGQVLLSQRRYAEAVPLFKEATERDPQNLEFTDGYLTALVATGKMDDAFKQLDSASKRFPGNGRIAYLAGRVNDALDNVKEAEGNYLRAESAEPALFEANLHLARMYLRLHRLDDARPQLASALKKAPKDAAVHTGLGELALAESDLDKGRTEFDLAIAADPNLPDAHLGQSKVALATGGLETAAAEVDRALDLDAHLKGGRLQKGLVLWKEGRLANAAAELEKAKAEAPKSAPILLALGAVKLDTNDLAEAETNLLAALAQEPSNPEAHFYVARVKNRRSEHTQAVESMKIALDHSPRRPDYHYEMGIIFRDAKRMNEAIEEWKQTVKLEPKNANALESLGVAFLDRGETETALRYFESSLGADPKRSRVQAFIGDCYFSAVRWDDAIKHYRKALESDATLKQVYFKLARCYTEKGKHAEAIGWYKKATAIDPGAPEPYKNLGFAFKEKGQKADAVSAFKSYLAKKPEAEDKKEIEDEIYYLQH